MVFTSFTYPIAIADEFVEFIEFTDDDYPDLRIDELCPDRANEIKADIYPYMICFKTLKVIGKTERLAELNTQEPFKIQLRKMFPELKNSTLNDFRRYLANRTITTMFFQNLWFDYQIDEVLGLPSTFEFDSEEMQIWKNFSHTSLKWRQPLIDTLRMTAHTEHLVRYREYLLRSSSETRLEEIHNEVTVEYNKIQELINGEKLQKPFPEAPAKIPPAPPTITWIKNGLELLREGQKMHHCVASYVDYCLSGTSFIYHVSVDGYDATLELSKAGAVKQFKSFHNSVPPVLCQEAVDNWLSIKSIVEE